MSLLNNALREAEERQRRPGVTGAYTGAVQQSRGGQRWIIVLVFLIAVGLVGAGIYWFAVAAPSSVAVERNAVPDIDAQGQIERPAVASENVAEPQPIVEAQQPAPELARIGTPQTMEIAEAVVPDEPPKRESVPASAAPEPKEPPPDTRTSNAAQPEAAQPEPPNEQAAPSLRPAADAEEQKSEQAATVKTAPKSPRAVDRQTAKELETLIVSGRMVAAERRLAGLIQTQAAPRSRLAVARALVIDGEIARALNWLPEDAAAGDAALRMLRARAQHADGQLDAAVATLETNVPAVSEQPAYRVTLATLLQQQGQGQEAAAHWAELIAWDDSRAPWWVGLAIALEDQGEIRGATRAYQQAAGLPGLSPSLADYVRRRLQSLRAG